MARVKFSHSVMNESNTNTGCYINFLSVLQLLIVLAPFAHCFITPFPLLVIIVPLSSSLSALHLSFSLQTINNGTHTSSNPQILSRSAFSFCVEFFIFICVILFSICLYEANYRYGHGANRYCKKVQKNTF